MKEIFAIARNTFKEAIRNRILYIILIFALILIGVSGVLSELSIISQVKVIKNLGFASIDFFAVAISVFVGVSLVYNEIEKKSIYTIVSKPISRGHFIVGKYLGLLATVWVNVFLMTFCFLIALHYYIGKNTIESEQVAALASGMASAPSSGFAGTFVGVLGTSIGHAFVDLLPPFWNHYEVTAHVMQVIMITCLELMIITAFSVLYSSFSTPTLSMIFTVLTFIAGRLNEDIIRFSQQIYKTAVETAIKANVPLHLPVSYYLASTASYVVPNLGAFSKTVEQAIYEPQFQIWWGTIVYAFLYTAGIICLSILIFMRRNFK